jgi:hypothetical protein
VGIVPECGGKYKFSPSSVADEYVTNIASKMATKDENDLFEIISSYSESNDSETQGQTFESSEDDNSETSEDRALVVSDGDQSPHSYGSSESFNYSQQCHGMYGDSSDLVSCMGTSFAVN